MHNLNNLYFKWMHKTHNLQSNGSKVTLVIIFSFQNKVVQVKHKSFINLLYGKKLFPTESLLVSQSLAAACIIHWQLLLLLSVRVKLENISIANRKSRYSQYLIICMGKLYDIHNMNQKNFFDKGNENHCKLLK